MGNVQPRRSCVVRRGVDCGRSKQGAACTAYCVGPTMILVVLGMMNPLVIIGVASVIAAEKTLPRPAIVVRLVGISTIISGVAFLWAIFFPSN